MSEEEIVPAPAQPDQVILDLAAKNRVVLSGNPCCPGCGCLLGLKLALQALPRPVLVVPHGCMAHLASFQPRVPVVVAGMNPAAVAAGLARSVPNVLVYAGDGMTRLHLESVLAAAERNDPVLYICYNNLGYCTLDAPFFSSFAPLMPSYAATASVSHPEDYLKKLQRAAALQGFRYLEVLTPCPQLWRFDASNTIEVARIGVESGLWPLYHVEGKRFDVTYKPSRHEPPERFFDLQARPFPRQRMLEWSAQLWKILK